MESSTKDKKNSYWAILVTVVFHALFLVLLLFMGLSLPFPLPLEQGVEVNLGNSLTGFGEEATEISGEAITPPSGTPAGGLQSTSSRSQFATQNSEQTIGLDKTTPQNTNQTTSQKPTKQEPTEDPINPNALFPGKKGSGTGTAQGSSQGIAGGIGDQGVPGGNPNSNNYSGTPGSGGGSGTSFSLTGRVSKSLPKPQYNSKEQGTVVVKIWVDKDGTVIKAEAGQRGTTVTDHSLWSMAEQAAKQSKFSADNNANEVQTGTITYKFLRNN